MTSSGIRSFSMMQAHEVEVGLGGRREADLDLLEPAAHQQVEHRALALDVHRIDQGLVAVAQVDAAPAGCPGDDAARPRPIRQRDRRERTIEMERHRCWRTGLRCHGRLLLVLTNKKASPIHGRGFSGARPGGRAPSSGTGSRAGCPRSSSSQMHGSRHSCARVLCVERRPLSTGGSPRGRLDFAEPALEEAALGRRCVTSARARRVALRRLRAVAEPAQQVGARGMQQVVAVELTGGGELVDEREGRGGAVHHRDGHGAVERDDRRGLQALEHARRAGRSAASPCPRPAAPGSAGPRSPPAARTARARRAAPPRRAAAPRRSARGSSGDGPDPRGGPDRRRRRDAPRAANRAAA